ncbi:MAG: hypothetical protein IE927_10670 [Rhodobacterales bacterium]|nr:hypothetical protein [Rhodobacterales bacterium]
MGARVAEVMALLPEDLRETFVLALARPLLDLGLDQIVHGALSDAVLTRALAEDQTLWRRTSALVPLAARGRFADCASVLEKLKGLEHPDRITAEDIDVEAIGFAVRAVLTARVSRDVFYWLIFAFIGVLKRFECRDFTLFRHAGLTDALVQMLLQAAREPDWFQRDLLQDCHEIARTAQSAMDDLRRFRAWPGDGGAATEVTATGAARVLACGERKTLLANFLDTHGIARSDAAGIRSPEGTERMLRQAAHPFAEATEATAAMPGALRRAISELQAYPSVKHRSVLETVGAALLAGDADRVLTHVPLLSENLIDDPPTEAVLLDALSWALGVRRDNPTALNAVILQVIRRLGSPGDALSVPPALHSAVRRLARLDGLPADAASQRQRMTQLYAQTFPDLPPPAAAPAPAGAGFFADTLIALVSCRKYLDSRAQECRDTWLADAAAAGAQVLIFCGSDDPNGEVRVDPQTGVVELPVGDAYEDLPAKIVEMMRWVHAHRPESFVLKLDDDCYLDARSWLGGLAYRRSHYFGRPLQAGAETCDRFWHQEQSARPANRRPIDTSLLGSAYADGAGGYCLSREALGILDRVAASPEVVQLRMSSFFADKMMGDLLRIGGLAVGSEGYSNIQARRTHSGGGAGALRRPDLLSRFGKRHPDGASGRHRPDGRHPRRPRHPQAAAAAAVADDGTGAAGREKQHARDAEPRRRARKAGDGRGDLRRRLPQPAGAGAALPGALPRPGGGPVPCGRQPVGRRHARIPAGPARRAGVFLLERRSDAARPDDVETRAPRPLLPRAPGGSRRCRGIPADAAPGRRGAAGGLPRAGRRGAGCGAGPSRRHVSAGPAGRGGFRPCAAAGRRPRP